MKQSHWITLFGIAAASLAISFIFMRGANTSPVAVPASLAFTFIGLLGGATAAAVRAIEKRLNILEQVRLAEEHSRAKTAEE